MRIFAKLLSLFLFTSFGVRAGGFSVSGVVKDVADSSVLTGVAVMLTSVDDTTQKTGSVTDMSGVFQIADIAPGKYTVSLAYLGYRARRRTVEVMGDTWMGTLVMRGESTTLKGVTVESHQIRAEQNGDTTQFHADAYKTHPDASAEDLVTKMPGVTSDNNGVKVNGESVQQIYVDGKPFFGNDPTLALRNLPAEVIDKIQIFDKMSDQATFTGFDDGNSQKTMNITTKRNKSEGIFGKFYGAGGTDDTYLGGGNLNIFDGDRRISILALTNNINQQNFSTQDILGVLGNSGGQNRGGGSGSGGAFGGGGGGGGSNNFMVNQQGGITTTNSIGLNYSDSWGKKVKVMGSYFYNSSNNTDNSTIRRNYFTSTDTSNVYNETDVPALTTNYNHRFNLRLEYTIDSYNSIIFTPSLNLQQSGSSSGTLATDSLGVVLSSQTVNNSTSNYSGYSSSGNLLIQHKFHKSRRTISLNLSPSVNEKSGSGAYDASNEYFAGHTSNVLNQNYTLNNLGYGLGASVNYTEPVGKKGQFMFNYSPSFSKNFSDKETSNFSDTTHAYTNLDTFYSNKYNSLYTTQKGGVSYRIGDKKFNFSFGVNYQYSELGGSQTFPYALTVPQKTFSDLLPLMFFNYRFADGRNLRIIYRTNISAPSVTQLQDVVDVSNPLLLKAGNPDLKQDYEQTIVIRYGLTKSKTAHNFFVYMYGNFISNYIGNATFQPSRDSSFQGPFMANPVVINKGSQLTLPVNLNSYWNGKAFVTYSVPFDAVKCNLNFNGGISYTRTPGLVNNQFNFSNNTVPTAGIVLSSNVSEKVDFTVAYTGNYNLVKNTEAVSANNNYYSHTASAKVNLIFLKHLVFNTNITNSYYAAFAGTAPQNYFLWNTYLAYKLMKKQALEVRLTCYDMLNQNQSIARTVTETYVQNQTSQVLRQYLMLQFTYTIRNFKGAPPAINADENRGERDHMPGFRPGGGGGDGNRNW